VRRFARELGADLNKILGTGRSGRVTKEDVQAFVKQTLSRPAAATGGAFSLPEMPAIDFAKFGSITRRELGRIKKLTGTNTQRAWITIPHVTQFDQADITELEAFRKEQSAAAQAKGVKLTLLAFLLKACAYAVREHPDFCASLEPGGEALILKQYVHIGVAVDTPDGLVVPVLRDVDKKGILALAEELGTVSARAREKKLKLDDLQGGCFTISSLGGIGGTAFTPIVNAPEVAILGVSRAAMQPVWREGLFQARLMLPLSLSYDHRVIDGAQAARFTTFLAGLLGDVRMLSL
jgi:pyruvate dehydrogenase E2 component (dihydrolipoamide acetyltransferase)